jgi:uncharacterized protein
MTKLLLAVVVFVQITPKQAERLRWVPNPRVANSTWVSDPSHHLKPATVDSLNSLLSALSRETGTEMTVVAIDSTSGYEPFDVALALHRMWGVGQKGRDNGIVLLWVPTQRAVQVSVGYGLEGVLPDSRVGRVRDQTIFPAFKKGEFDAGMLAGVAAIAAIAREEKDARGATMSTTNPPPNAAAAVERDGANSERSRPGRSVGRRTGIVFGGIGAGAALLGGVAGAARYRRRRPKRCPNGHGLMTRLDESADDAHLDPGQRMEEQLESVDYDVWVCPTCQYALTIPHRAWFSSYSTCKSCNRRTLETGTRTLRRATTMSEGLQEITERCRNCAWTRTYTRVIPRVVQSSGSSGGSGGSGGGGGSRFGGGSAGGGGAGGHY